METSAVRLLASAALSLAVCAAASAQEFRTKDCDILAKKNAAAKKPGAAASVYEGSDPYGDARAAFDRLKAVSGLRNVALEPMTSPGSSEAEKELYGMCMEGGVLAIPSIDGAPPYVLICGAAFSRARKIEHLAYALGHELAHFKLDTFKFMKKAEQDTLALWFKKRSPEWRDKTPAAQRVNDLLKTVCPSLTSLSKKFELRCDELGLRWSKQAGIDPAAAAGMHDLDEAADRAEGNPSGSAGHPTNKERKAQALKLARELKGS
ncbi:MAG: M48 family metalloprotease [Elusimicrobia bacterium]|nr:M48 family metalloprotease [Elusimicrobiota bacterium]